jgi:hypothetical protein
MLQIVSSQLRRVADMFLFAAGLDKDKLHEILEKLKDFLEDKSLFEIVDKDPLTFNKKGLQKLQGIGAGHIAGPSFKKVIQQLDGAIKLAVKTGDKDLISLDNYLEGSLRKRPGNWTAATYKGMAFDLAKDRALTNVIEPMSLAMSAVVKPT